MRARGKLFLLGPGTGAFASGARRRLVRGPHDRLSDVANAILGCQCRAGVQLVSQLKGFTDAQAERVVVDTGEDAVTRVARSVHIGSLGPYGLCSIGTYRILYRSVLASTG